MSSLNMIQGGIGGSWLQIADEEKGDLWKPAWNFGYQNRGPQAIAWQWGPMNAWPNAGFMSGDPSVPLCMFSQDAQQNDIYEPWNYGLGGKSRPYFIRGICKDGSGNILGGALVHVYDSATDIFEGQIATNDLGVFEVPCLNTSAKYLRAFYPSGNLAGASVETLVPTL